MNPSISISNFFKEVGSEVEQDKEYNRIIFVLVNEFHWSQEDIIKSDLPFVLELLDTRRRLIKEEQDKQSKIRR